MRIHREGNALAVNLGPLEIKTVGVMGYATLCGRGLCWVGWHLSYYRKEATRHA